MTRLTLPPPGSVRRRLLVWNVGVLACVLLVLGIVFRVRLQADGISAMDRHLSQVAHVIARRGAEPGERFGPPPPPWSQARFPVLSPQGRTAFTARPLLPPSGEGEPERMVPNSGRRRGEQEARGGPEGPSFVPPPDNAPGGLRRFRPRLLDTQGHSLFPGDHNPPWSLAAYHRALGGEESAVSTMDRGEPIRVYSLPLRRGAHIDGVVQTAGSLAPLRTAVGQLTRTGLTLIPLALLAAAFGGAFLTGRALRPVREITQAAEQMEASSLGGRLPVSGTDEFAHLAATFNAMLERLEGAFGQLDYALQQQKRFAADASHELRTPLTIIKANTSLALSGERTTAQYRQALAASDKAADRMTRIVQDLLLLARSDAGQWQPALAAVALGDILTQAAEPLRTNDAPPIVVDPALADWCVLGDAHSLTRLFGNLLENAVRHTPPTGRIDVSAYAEGHTVTVFIADTGEGIAPAHLPHVTERFYRVDAARARADGGTGLGLAICLSIAHAHGGTLTLHSAEGAGTTVRVCLPCAASPSPVS